MMCSCRSALARASALRSTAFLSLAIVTACGSSDRLTYSEASAELMRPVKITGSGRHDLWSVVDPASSGSPFATIAHSTDGRAATWSAITVPELEPQAVQLGIERNKVWVAGSRTDGAPGLGAVIADDRGLTIVDVSSIFPSGSSDLVLRSGGIDPDPMITVSVPGVPQQRVAYVLDSSFRNIWYQPQDPPLDFSLVAVFDHRTAYFVLHATTGDTLALCHILFGSITETICIEVPEWTAGLDQLYASTSGGTGDWLWRPSPTGGDAMVRRGGGFAQGRVTGWPEELVPLRFLARRDGPIGILAERSGSLVWVELDAYLAVKSELFLVACEGACDVNVPDVALLHDGALLVPTSRGWYLGGPDWHFE